MVIVAAAVVVVLMLVVLLLSVQLVLPPVLVLAVPEPCKPGMHVLQRLANVQFEASDGLKVRRNQQLPRIQFAGGERLHIVSQCKP